MRSYILLFLCVFVTALSFSQPVSIEALMQELDSGVTDKRRVNIYADLAYNHVWSDAAKAHEYADDGIQLADSINYEFGRAKCLSEAGLALLYQGNGPESLEFLFEALETLKDHDDDFWMFTTLSSIGYVYWEQNEHASSILYFKQAEPYSESLGIDNFRISILSDIGETYIQLEEVDSARKYIRSSFDLAITTKDTFQIAVTSNQMGIVDRLSGDLNEALYHSRFGLPYAAFVQFNPRRTYLNMAEVFELQGQLDSCIYYSDRCVSLAKAGSFMDNSLLRSYTLLANAYESSGQQDSMFVYLKKQIEANSIIANKEKTKRIQGIVFERQLNQTRIEQARKDAEMVASLRRQKMITRVGSFIALIILIFSSLLVNRYRVIQKQKRSIQKEKDRSENLLLNILPAEIAEELKTKGRADARDFEMVSIIFTDFKEFTQTSEKLSAQELVAEINTCFEAFDGIIEKYKVEKIKTIGDAYMAAGGLPVPTDGSEKNTVLAGLEMQAFISKRKAEMDSQNKLAFEMRVGIHTGPVVAGIVGVKKFQYDIWGDTVNTASRIESNGEAGKVNISQATYELLKDDTQFTFESRGKIQAKGKGDIEMYFVDLS